MAIQLNNTSTTRRRIERRADVHRMPKWYPHSAVWRVYTDPSGGGDFNTYYGNIRSDFNLVSYWVFFSMGSAGGNDYAIGADGSDAESGVTRITGRWQRMACRIPGLGLDIQFWWDLPDTAAVVSKNLTNAFTTHTTHRLAFGAPAHTDNEGIAGRLAWIKIWEYALPQAALIRESESPWPVLKEYEPYLYAVVPCTGPNVENGQGSLPTYVAAGAIASGTGTITPALPAGIATNDILILCCESANQTVTISNSAGGTWTVQSSSEQGVGTAGATGATRCTVFWSRYNGTQTAPTVADPGDHVIGRMIAVRGCVTSGDPFDASSGGTENTSDTSGSINGLTTTVENCFVVAAITSDFDPASNATTHFSSWANGDLGSVTERIDNARIDGNGGTLGVATGTRAAIGTIGATTVTHASAGVKSFWCGALKPAPSAVDMPVYLDYSGKGNHFYPYNTDPAHARAVDPGPSFPPRFWKDVDLDLDADAISSAPVSIRLLLSLGAGA